MLHLLERLAEIESGTPAGLANMISFVGLLILVLSEAVWRFAIEALDRVVWLIAAICALRRRQAEPAQIHAPAPRSDSALHLPTVAAVVFVVCPITITIATHHM